MGLFRACSAAWRAFLSSAAFCSASFLARMAALRLLEADSVPGLGGELCGNGHATGGGRVSAAGKRALEAYGRPLRHCADKCSACNSFDADVSTRSCSKCAPHRGSPRGAAIRAYLTNSVAAEHRPRGEGTRKGRGIYVSVRKQTAPVRCSQFRRSNVDSLLSESQPGQRAIAQVALERVRVAARRERTFVK